MEEVAHRTLLGSSQNKRIANESGQVARNARIDLEKRLGETVISSSNSKNIDLVENK